MQTVEHHIDEFIDDFQNKEYYARWFFFLKRLPATAQAEFGEWIDPYQLYCTHEGKRWRVTGASRLGDVWLASNLSRDMGYDKRVDVTTCSNWGDKP